MLIKKNQFYKDGLKYFSLKIENSTRHSFFVTFSLIQFFFYIFVKL